MKEKDSTDTFEPTPSLNKSPGGITMTHGERAAAAVAKYRMLKSLHNGAKAIEQSIENGAGHVLVSVLVAGIIIDPFTSRAKDAVDATLNKLVATSQEWDDNLEARLAEKSGQGIVLPPR